MTREINSTQPYADLLVKLIPTEIVGAYMVLAGLLGSGSSGVSTLTATIPDNILRNGLIQAVFFVLLILTPFYLWFVTNIRNKLQIAVCTVSFIVWVYTLGGPFVVWGFYYSLVSSVILVLWTLITSIYFQAKKNTL
jgi:hypothetical protein